MRRKSNLKGKRSQIETRTHREGDGSYGYHATRKGTDVGTYGSAPTKREAQRKAKKAKAKILRRNLNGRNQSE